VAGHVRGATDGGHGDGGAEKIGDDHPLDAVDVRFHGRHHLGQDDIDDGRVQEGNEDGDRHQNGDQPFVCPAWF